WQKGFKVDDFYAARSRAIPPLPWSNIAPPFSLPGDASCSAFLVSFVIQNIINFGPLRRGQITRPRSRVPDARHIAGGRQLRSGRWSGGDCLLPVHATPYHPPYLTAQP
uniref:hypothetical protein n=1 Tax=Edaphosphingomonas laterariae TaxID=861865 RepID=UPI001C530747